MNQISDISKLVKQSAEDAGFELAGIAPVDQFPELRYFPEWIAAGHAGEMEYLEARDAAGDLKRASLKAVAPWARSVIVCAINYNTAQFYSTQARDAERGWISRYAWSSEDYHKGLMRRLREVEAKLRSALSTSYGAEQPVPLQTRCYVDTGPIIERVFAKYAGVGWIGKNTCILNQKLGSWLFLGVILTSLELHPDLPAPDRCGTCSRCIDACPTNAFIGPYRLDANKCISYLTIEKRGSIPEELRPLMGRHVIGCDICQDVCPWNRKAPATAAPDWQPRAGLVDPALEPLAEISETEFREKFRGSPVRRATRAGLRRNAVIAMGNSGNQRFIPKLEELARDEDQTLAEHALWALKRLAEQA